MLTFHLSPGVHVDEPYRLSLPTSRSATAVPVFIVNTANETPWWAATLKPVIVRSFSEYVNWLNNPGGTPAQSRKTLKRGGAPSATSAVQGSAYLYPVLSEVTVPGLSGLPPDWTTPFAPALKAYFDNGGSWCYLCPHDKLDWIKNLPDATLVVQAGQPVSIVSEILTLCQPGGGLFALLDVPSQPGTPSASLIESYLDTLVPSESAAFYFPWLKASWNLRTDSGGSVADINEVAPSAVAAGLICQTDRSLGPWKAPANLSVSKGLTAVARVGDTFQAQFTSADFTRKSVNMFRDFPQYGVQLWGARTLTVTGHAMGYISVRRALDMIERDLQQTLIPLLFEPNGPVTWQRIYAATDSYLNNLMQQGAFAATSKERSYRIDVGAGVSGSAEDLEKGILRLRVGVAIVRPSEFIVLEFSHQLNAG